MKKPPPRLQSVTTHFLRKLSHPPPNIKQSIPNSLTSKTNFAHYDYKPSNSKKFFFKSVPLFPLPRNPHFQSGTRPARPQERSPPARPVPRVWLRWFRAPGIPRARTYICIYVAGIPRVPCFFLLPAPQAPCPPVRLSPEQGPCPPLPARFPPVSPRFPLKGVKSAFFSKKVVIIFCHMGNRL